MVGFNYLTANLWYNGNLKLSKLFLHEATSTKQGSSELHIHVRSKRFMSKMPRMPSNLQHPNNTEEQSANLKDSSKNISLVLADLLDDYDYNQRPGYGGEQTSAG